MTQTLNGKTALVTGAARGIGRAVASSLAAAGARVALADVDMPAEALEEITRAGGDAAGYACDVSSEEQVLSLFSDIKDRFGRLDVAVTCAGIIDERALLDTGADQFDRVIAVNLRGTFLVGREALRMMAGAGSGRLITVASDLAHKGRETFSAYVASKHGVLGLTRSWALEFGPDIQVNAICPGPIDTVMLDAGNMSPEWRQKELDIPLARFGRPEEIAAMAVFLAGPDGAYITGQGIGVNGGSVMP